MNPGDRAAIPFTSHRPPPGRGLGDRLGVFRAIAACLLAAWPFGAFAQLTPVRACATVDKPILVTVRDPLDRPASEPELTTVEPKDAVFAQRAGVDRRAARFRVEMWPPGAEEPAQVASVVPGEVDLARLFPSLWSDSEAKIVAAQLAVARSDGERFEPIGPALWLVPMVTPAYAARLDRDGLPVFVPSRSQLSSGYWLRTDAQAVIKTDAGTLTFRLRTDAAPTSVEHFKTLASAGFYDDTPLFRVTSLRGLTKPDVVQFGDPTGAGQGGPGYMIDLEQTGLRHGYGVMSYARTADPNSAGSQVIIGLNREGTAALDGRYAAFAELVDGAEALAKLSKTPVDADGRPNTSVLITSVRVVDAPPLPRQPAPLKDPVNNAAER